MTKCLNVLLALVVLTIVGCAQVGDVASGAVSAATGIGPGGLPEIAPYDEPAVLPPLTESVYVDGGLPEIAPYDEPPLPPLM